MIRPAFFASLILLSACSTGTGHEPTYLSNAPLEQANSSSLSDGVTNPLSLTGHMYY